MLICLAHQGQKNVTGDIETILNCIELSPKSYVVIVKNRDFCYAQYDLRK